MKRIILLIVSGLFCFQSLSQWIDIGNHGTRVSMTSNRKGFKTTYTTGSPGYLNYKFTQTNTDWVYENDVIDYYSNVPGCCWIESIHFVNDTVGIKVNNGQYNLSFSQTTDGGNSWVYSDTILRFNPFQILSINNTLSFVGYNDNDHDRDYQFYEFVNGDLNLLYVNDSLELGGRNIEFINTDTGFVVLNSSSKSFLFKTIDGGNNWDTTFYYPNYSVFSTTFGSDSVGFIAGSSGYVFKSIDYGQNWNQLISPTTTQINSIDFFNDTIGFIVCNQGEVYKTLDGGNSWINEFIPGASNLLYVKVVDIKHAYTYDSNGILYKQGSVLGINKKEEKVTYFKVYPNPVSFVLNIESDVVIEKATICNSIGQILIISTDTGIDVSSLNSGIYILIIESENVTHQMKFIIK